MNELKSDSAIMAAYRSDMYGFLARIYRSEPDSALIEKIKAGSFLNLLKGLGESFDQDFLDQPTEKQLEDLAVEYTRLFVGPGKHISPHESVHHELTDGGKWGTLWGDSTVEVTKFIESSGLKLSDKLNLIPDHISVEMEFMQIAALEESKTRDKNDEDGIAYCLDMQQKFINSHISKWILAFCDKVIEQAKNSFYREMAKLTKKFVELELSSVCSE